MRFFFFFSSRRRHTRYWRDWSSDVCSSDLVPPESLPPQDGTHRILHIHRNVPGVLGEINSKLSARGVNILGQYLKTSDRVGYVILDVDTDVSREALEMVRGVRGTIKTRVVY